MTRRRSRAAPTLAAAAAAAAAVPSLLATTAAASVLRALPLPPPAAAVGVPLSSGGEGVVVRQAVDASAVAASWALSNGAVAGCPQTVVISGDENDDGEGVTSLSAASLVVDGASCSAGGEVAVLPGTADGVNGPTADILRAADDSFTFGIVSEPLTCGRWEWPVNTAAYFFGGGPSELTVGSGADAVELPADIRFLSVQFPDTTRPSCVYSASAEGGGEEGGGSGGGGTRGEEGGSGGGDGSTDGATVASPTAEADESACFPAAATVEVEARGPIAMSDLRLGDRVRVSATTFEPVVLFSHRDAAATGEYVALSTASGRVLVATTGHLVYTASAGTASGWTLTRAGSVVVGDVLPLGDASDGGRVVAVAQTTGSGLYNPHTPSGDLVVDGVRVSAYTTAVPMGIARTLLAPISAAASCGLIRETTAGRVLAGGAPAAAAVARWVAGAWQAVGGSSA
ncbi:hypothetical protein MMPV_006329 [Pyropia vietnamensis]